MNTAPVYRAAVRVICAMLVGTVLAAMVNVARGEVSVYPAPDAEVLSTDYTVRANGKKVDVYTARTLDPPFADGRWDHGGPYSFANFDMSGQVTVRITSPRSLHGTIIRPLSDGVEPKIEDEHTITIRLDQPRKLSIEPDGKQGPLLLFANPMEENVPQPDDESVLYYGPGIHKPGRIEIGAGQTLYLAGGAVVKAGVVARGDNIQIRGRGILDGSDWEWRKGPTPTVMGLRGNNIEVSGITIRGASHWTIVPRHCRDVTVRNVKICNSRVQNDDGINPCNSQDVLITDCFIRGDDDCIAMKGLKYMEGKNNNIERITVENCTLWCDRARIFLLGHESRAEFMRRVTLRNLDIIHFTMTPFLFEPGEDMRLEQVTVENVRIWGEGQRECIRLRPVVNQYMRKKVPGHIGDIRFENVTLTGRPGDYPVQLIGADEDHRVKDVTFADVSIRGKSLGKNSENVRIGEHVEGVEFKDGNP
ncbi:MAG: glycosyl hydrolase family 28 protein [Planctomycetota bacterium]